MLHCERVVLLRLALLLQSGDVLLRHTPPRRNRPDRGATNFSGPADVIETGTNADGPALKIVPSAIEWYPDQRKWDRKESRRRAVPVLQRHYCGIQPPDQSIRRAERGPACGSRACAHVESASGPRPHWPRNAAQCPSRAAACRCRAFEANRRPTGVQPNSIRKNRPLATRCPSPGGLGIPSAARWEYIWRLAETEQSEIEPRRRSENDVRLWTVRAG